MTILWISAIEGGPDQLAQVVFEDDARCSNGQTHKTGTIVAVQVAARAPGIEHRVDGVGVVGPVRVRRRLNPRSRVYISEPGSGHLFSCKDESHLVFVEQTGVSVRYE